MKIKRIKLENIRSYENEEIVFQDGSILLAGDIGAGKSTILLAIEFALFGLQPGQRGTGLLRNGKEEGRVILEIEVDGKSVSLERGLERGKSVSQSYSSVTIDNEKKEMSVTELKNFVLSLLSYPKEFEKKTNILYKFTVYTPQEEMKQIILEDSELRLNTLRYVFGVDKYKRIRENAQAFCSKMREEIREKKAQIGNIESLREELEIKKKNISNISERIEENKKILELKKKEKEDIEKEISNIEDRINEKRKLESEVEKTKIMLVGKKDIINSLSKDQEKLERDLSQKIEFNESFLSDCIKQKETGSIDEKKKNEEYSRILAEMKSLEIKNWDLEEKKIRIEKLDRCPTCLQDVQEVYKKNIFLNFESEITENKKKIIAFNDKKLSLSREIEEIRKNQKQLEDKISEQRIIKIKLESMKEKQSRFEENKRKIETNEKDISILDKHIETIKESISLIGSIDIVFNKQKETLDNKRREERAVEIKIAELKKEIEMTEYMINDINKAILEKESLKLKLNNLINLEKWLSEDFLNLVSFTERNVMFKLKEEFSRLFNKWFSILVPENFFARLDEDFTPVIEQGEFELSYNYLSGGERTAVALAYRLALNQVINSLLSKVKTRDLIILDEPTDGFSEAQLDKFGEVFSELKFSQLIIVSHEQKIESFVENVLRFKKENGVSRVS